MADVSREDLSFCWEQVLRHDPWFRLHYLFAPGKHAEAILAVHALTGLLEETLDSSEESLTITRLQWWRSELEPETAQVSAHPVLRALRESREGELLPSSITDPLMAQILLRLQAEPLPDEEALRSLSNRVGRARIAVQLALTGVENTQKIGSWHCAGSGLASLMDFAIRSKQNGWWFVPLELQARYQFDMNDAHNTGAGTQDVLQTLTAWLDEWFEEQIVDIVKSNSEYSEMKRHLVAMTRANKIRMNRIIESLLRGETGNPSRWRVNDFLKVWSSSRRV